MARRRNPLLRSLLTGLTLGFATLTRLLLLPVARVLTKGLGRIAYYLVPRIRKVGLGNLDLAYGDQLTRKEKVRILRGAVDNVALVAAEFTRIPKLAGRSFAGHGDLIIRDLTPSIDLLPGTGYDSVAITKRRNERRIGPFGFAS